MMFSFMGLGMSGVRIRRYMLGNVFFIQRVQTFFSERELKFMFAICHRPSVCRLSSVVCRLSVTLVHPTQAIKIFGAVSTPFGTLAIC